MPSAESSGAPFLVMGANRGPNAAWLRGIGPPLDVLIRSRPQRLPAGKNWGSFWGSGPDRAPTLSGRQGWGLAGDWVPARGGREQARGLLAGPEDGQEGDGWAERGTGICRKTERSEGFLTDPTQPCSRV